ncbi:YIP1 family protein [Sagittula marina]|uniref:YIP1 family protein n=1 Tax=Sagittula marina TaxID=943940 RepID=UPI00160C3904|nr:YIP1 family protein [Sagittula marina]
MAVSSDIAAMYRCPAEVIRRKLSLDESEPRALAYLMAACAFMFVAQLPSVSRRVSLADPDRWAGDPGAYQQALQPALGGALLATMIFWPLILYALAALGQMILRVLRQRVSGYEMRIALFWGLLSAAPIALLAGLTAGFVGQGIELTVVGVLWLLAVMWFVATGVRVARRQRIEETV